VTLIVYYVVFMIVGDFAAYFLGLFTEYEWGSQVSLIVFLALYFLFLWVSWVLAVRVTKPKTAANFCQRNGNIGEPIGAEPSSPPTVTELLILAKLPTVRGQLEALRLRRPIQGLSPSKSTSLHPGPQTRKLPY